MARTNKKIRLTLMNPLLLKLVLIVTLVSQNLFAQLSTLQQIDVGSFEKMKEVERYQIRIAEKHFLNGNYKVALSEYEKFLTLYEKSAGAPYAQLMWSHTMMNLKKPKTALRDGFQSVIDYWPDSNEATIAAYCMGDAYRKMGEVADAQKSFRFLIKEYPKHEIAMRAREDLLHYARLHQDLEERLLILNDLTFNVERNDLTKASCIKACHELAELHCFAQNLDKGKKALATTYTGTKLFDEVYQLSFKTLNHFLKTPETKPAALKLGDQLISTLRAEGIERPESAKGFLYQVAALHQTLSRSAETMKVYREIGESFGIDDDLRGRMAEWYIAQKNRDEARRTYLSYDNKIAGLQKIAAMFLEEKKPEKAIEIYRQLIDIDPDHSVAHLTAIASVYSGLSDWLKAISVYRELIEINGDNSGNYLWTIAGCYESLLDWKKAIACYRQVDRFPANYFAIAKCHRKIGEYEEAILLYNQCKIVENAAPEASLQIGFTYEEAEQKAKAIRTFQLTCKRYPKSAQASKAHSHLQNQYNIFVTLGGAEEE